MSQSLLRRLRSGQPHINRATVPRYTPPRFTRQQLRYASSTDNSKAIPLEQPDKFRPPSHAARLVRPRGRGNTFGGAYNQGSTQSERDAQRRRRYPHMFPDEGTFMHSFLTNRKLHVLITLSVLLFLASVTMVQTFVKTSPFGHLMPTLSSFPLNPYRFVSDAWTVFKLHQDYNTEKVEFQRARNILDAQKRRIYRRAHGMEDLDRDEDQGVDVRGIVPWDDGLTKREREAGGIGANRVKMIHVVKQAEGGREAMEAAANTREMRAADNEMKRDLFIRQREAELGLTREEDPAVAAQNVKSAEEKGLEPRIPRSELRDDGEQTVRRRKLWLGIW